MKSNRLVVSIFTHLSNICIGGKNLLPLGVLILLLQVSSTRTLAQNALRDIPSPDPQIQKDMFQVAEGFEVNLFASDPEVVKPIQMNWDAEGRLWVVSSTAYPHLRPGETANDKIMVLEDTNGDGKSDKSTVFAEGLITPTGILPGDGGVYVANSTEILHLKDTNEDGKADVEEKILTGFGTGDTHHLIHTFRWGPDGLMYFNQSIYIYSHVETPWGIRRLEGGGVWQYDPQTKKLEVFARGLINPWGLQFDKWGKAFLTDGAGTEGINYAFPGATFVTAPGAERVLRGLNPGQPKHSGLDIVSGNHLPESWQGSLITNDFRANRVNRFVVQETANGMVSAQADDLLWTDHIGFRPVDILVGPDGAIYIADWYNPIIQHGEVDFHDPRRDQQHGRIWRLTQTDRPLSKIQKLTGRDISQLLSALKAPDNHTRIQARLLLKEKNKNSVVAALETFVQDLEKEDPDYEQHLLEALWTYQAIGEVNPQLLEELLAATHAGARAAAVRVLSNWYGLLPDGHMLLKKAVRDADPFVRLESIVALGNHPAPGSAALVLQALDQPMNEFLDFALWQAIRKLKDLWLPEVLADQSYLGNDEKTVFALMALNERKSTGILLDFLMTDKIPESYVPKAVDAMAANADAHIADQLYQKALADPEYRTVLLDALIQIKMQAGIQPINSMDRIGQLYRDSNPAVVKSALNLAGLWNLETQLDPMVRYALEDSGDLRIAAIRALAAMDSERAKSILVELSKDNADRSRQVIALSQLAKSRPEAAISITTDLWKTSDLPETEISSLFGGFLSSETGTQVLYQALMEEKIPEDIAKTGRKAMQQYLPWHRRNNTLSQNLRNALEASGGVLPPERMPQQLTQQQVYVLAQEVKTKANPVMGESIYRKQSLMCQNCHALGGAGGKLGPDLSALGTSLPIDNIIESLIDPAASVKEGYELQKVTKADGSLMMGYLVSDGANELIMRDMAGNEITIPKSQVAARENVSGSLMPPRLTAGLERQEFIDLVGYLSKLGTSGNFRVPTANYVRRWEAFSAIDTDLDDSGQLSEGKSIQLYSMVSGSLPVAELPVLKNRSGKEMAVLQFELELLSEGKVALEFNETKGLSVWSADQMASIQANTALLQLSKGKHLIQVSIDLAAFNPSALRLKVTDQGSAQSRL
ncbi:putative membrane-bound dehydrogenase domain-containing protein [Cyclobacterium lianum]|uniref:Putative membrane-bound dehydrogenase domain-containing protein n=1 Tax=Cyclobacterium lianum TaxID=388280 RepID=A0A1M7M1I3_9BACT|nr:PVC-type heme-binding CxxCH protein [Cyclobacterium lianum]SHM84026.1 putative membrane-bound dehydrogenase domain-containing protein [Cyclobacterium lianum]